MSSPRASKNSVALTPEVIRYVANGAFATLVHYAALDFLISTALFSTVGLANMVAALFGIAVSFLGSRYFVFRSHSRTILAQLIRFVPLYAAIACLHGGLLFLWADVLQLYYVFGFVLAIGLQVAISFVANKYWVFNR